MNGEAQAVPKRKIAVIGLASSRKKRATSPRKEAKETLPEPWQALITAFGGVLMAIAAFVIGCLAFVGKGFEGGFDAALRTYRKGNEGMTAEIKPRIDFEGRTRLETVIPLSTPYLVFLDPSDVCNAHCPHCPTGSGEALKWKKPRLMEFDLFKKIIDDLASMPKPIKTLRLYKDGEPLLNPDFSFMVQYAKNTGRFLQVDTTTNGLLLDTEMTRRLADCGLDKIFISVPQNYTKEYVSNVAYFRLSTDTQIYVKMIGDGLLESQRERFMDDFGDFTDRIFIEHLAPCWPDFEVKGVGEVGIYGQPIQEAPKVCSYIFYSTAINSDGTVSMCFLDWRHEMLLGDLKGESFEGIWNGAYLKMIQILHLRKYRSKISTNCANCKQLIYGAPDNLDEYAGEIQRRME